MDKRWTTPWITRVDPEEKQQRRRQALLTDLFITGTNAITEPKPDCED